jgi:hypothetical protein
VKPSAVKLPVTQVVELQGRKLEVTYYASEIAVRVVDGAPLSVRVSACKRCGSMTLLGPACWGCGRDTVY